MRRTKIICTLGPSTDDENILRQLIQEGMDVARFNFSHQVHEDHLKRLTTLKRLREELNVPVAALMDTRGPEIRLGTFKNGKIFVKKGQTFTFFTQPVEGTESEVFVTYKHLDKDLTVGDKVLVDDGLVEMTVTKITQGKITCRVENDGELSDRKGMNFPNVHLSIPFISEQDKKDIKFAVDNDFDFIAASFTRTAQDIIEIRRVLYEYNCKTINIIAKIENAQGVRHIDEIIKATDGIMVARGDMGVEIPLEDVPVIQKEIIKKVYMAGKQVITATQMLNSMMTNPRPTRAETTDVANAIYDGTSATMLSGETAASMYPVEALRVMSRIAERTEADIDYVKRFYQRELGEPADVTNAISHATCSTAHDLKAPSIVTVTKSGRTARMISKYRPNCLIVGCTTEEHVCRQLNLSWGVKPLLIEEKETTDTLFDHAVDLAEAAGLIKAGELSVITAGVPLGVSGTTNMMKVQVVGHIIVSGRGITPYMTRGKLCVCKNVKEAQKKFAEGDILVVPETTNEMLPLIKKARGIITEVGGGNSHAAIVGLTLDIPVIIGAKDATKVLSSGAFIAMNGESGTVSSV